MTRIVFSIRTLLALISVAAVAVWLMSETTLSVSAKMEFWELQIVKQDSTIGIYPADEVFESEKAITCQFCGYDPEREKLVVKMPRWSSLRIQLGKNYDASIFQTTNSEWIATADWFQVIER